MLKVKKLTMMILALLPLFASAVMLFFLPEQIPAHFNAAGVMTRMGSKYETLILPVFVIIFIGVFYGKFCDLSKDEKNKLSANIWFAGAVAAGIVFNCITFDMLYRAAAF